MSGQFSTATVLSLLELGLEEGVDRDDDFFDELPADLSLEHDAEIQKPQQPRRIAGYELVKAIASGGMGTVWQAKSRRGRVVALKLMHPNLLQSERETAHFIRTGELAAELRHPHIVRVLHVGVEQCHPFIVMDLVQGESLACPAVSSANERESLLRALVTLLGTRAVPEPQRKTAALVSKVAVAVAYAHERDVLHRDIKPSNILMDERGEPQLVDFGLAHRLNRKDSSLLDGTVRGSIEYMSPEQARGGIDCLTPRADIYSLGATLYELLTGRPPFSAPTSLELLEKLKGPEPPLPARELCPDVHPYLEAVCIKCLQKDPSRRYASASELAEDLVAISEGKPPAIRSLSRVQRLVYWAWRHPRATTRVAGAVALLSAVFALGLLLWQAQARRTSEQLANNAAIASGQAGAVLFQLRSYGDKISRATSVPEIVAYTHEAEITENVGPELKRAAEGFDAVFVVSRSGYMRAQWPLPPANLKLRDYSFRNYFRGAAELAALGRRVVHVARAFRSERDAEMKFGLSMPIFEGDTWVGVMVGIISTDSVFGRLQLPKDSERSVALIGPRDQERNEPAPSSRRFVYLVHERLKQGQEVAAPLPAGLRHFDGTAEDREPFELVYDGSATYADFSDPLYEAGNHWAAAFAPVGRTGYVIVAQSRKLRTWDWWFAW